MLHRNLMITMALAAAAIQGHAAETGYSPWAEKDWPREVYWGDTHLHTSWSLDANLFGAVDMTPADAYRFARGEAIEAGNGMVAQLNQPLDFLVVADHAEYLGVMRLIRREEPALMASETARRWRDYLLDGNNIGKAMLEIGASYATGIPLVTIPEGVESPWLESIRMAEAANVPGSFTTLIGFEWSAMPDGNNLHRVVVFRDGAERVSQIEPFSAFDSDDPEDLWQYLARYERETGGRVLAIPHNSNVSGGLMFAETDLQGNAITAQYGKQRNRWEPIIEVTQIKGDSEAHPLLSPNDEFADYGTWDQTNIAMSTPQEPWMFQYEYARPALKTGLRLSEKLDVNPYRFGMIGSTDSHTGMAAVEEDNFWGKKPDDAPSAERALKSWGLPEAGIPNSSQQAAGYAAVWATENTRAAIFDAMLRKEVYASTGPRIRVRFFGGWDYRDEDLAGPHPALTGYRKGVPMGADLPPRVEAAKAPSFMVWALKDAGGANLDRVQIVKGWLGGDGATRERVYNVAWSGDRAPDRDGQLPAVGDTVDRETARYRNTIGAAQLATVWTDPDFDPDQPAFYYVRVLEIPTPRWVLYDRARLGAELPADTRLVHQERAYTSPIWYQPLENRLAARHAAKPDSPGE